MTLQDPALQGERLLRHLNVVRMRARFMPAQHPSVKQAVVDAHRLLLDLFREDGAVTLVMRAGEAYLNGWRLPKESLRYATLIQLLKQVGVHAMQFLPGLPEHELMRFLEACFVRDTTAPDPARIRLLQEHRALPHIQINQDDIARELQKAPERMPAPLSHAREVYQQAIRATVEAHYDTIQGQGVNVQLTLRIVDALQDGLVANTDAFFAMSQLREFSEYTFYHSVNVAIISMLIGKGVGLDQEAVRRLGLAAMLHDLGKVLVPADVLEKPGKLDAKERAVIEAHPVDSVRILLEQKDICPAALAVAAQHHAQFNLSGYPNFQGFGPLHLFSHITAIADVYDALRSARSYKPAMLPDKAMEILLEGTGTQFHPVLVKAFFRMVGFFPVGSAVELNTGELALVTKANPGAPLTPEIKIIGGDTNGAAQRIINLNEPGQFGEQSRAVLRAIDPSPYGIRPSDFL